MEDKVKNNYDTLIQLEQESGIFREIDVERCYRLCRDNFIGIKFRDFRGALQFDGARAWLVNADSKHGLVGPDDIGCFNILVDSREFCKIADELRR